MVIHLRCKECEHYTGEICPRANPSCIVKRTYPLETAMIVIAILSIVIAIGMPVLLWLLTQPK